MCILYGMLFHSVSGLSFGLEENSRRYRGFSQDYMRMLKLTWTDGGECGHRPGERR